MTENQIQTPDVFSPDTQVVIKQQHKIAGALKDMLEKRPRPADDIGRVEKLPPIILFHHLELLQRTFQQSDRRLQGVISKTMVFDILARLEISISESVLADIIR